jgi:hypothetical protein
MEPVYPDGAGHAKHRPVASLGRPVFPNELTGLIAAPTYLQLDDHEADGWRERIRS